MVVEADAVQENHTQTPHIHGAVQLEELRDEHRALVGSPPSSSLLVGSLLDDVAALQNFRREVDEVGFLDLVLVEEHMAEVLNFYLSAVVEEDVLHAEHSLEAILQALDLGLQRPSWWGDFRIPVQVLNPLQHLEADLNQELLAQYRLLRLSCAEEVEQAEVVRLADQVDALLVLVGGPRRLGEGGLLRDFEVNHTTQVAVAVDTSHVLRENVMEVLASQVVAVAFEPFLQEAGRGRCWIILRLISSSVSCRDITLLGSELRS
mmetsp:Transcript_15683/g.24059  ORF Transcript_15683/g.24059 Transcript_15683/m.24059 type:complete len:263 (-) Transcript_15683:387-1175(-)